ncbi:MAG: right-handed parallel beta-helix repeat-containing protein [Bryobacterales bacterium]|nr:right-handed parallel beta-helix repeat-containing protein [Bryobacterales bacterium]MBV9401360.1 right-handed parallel beta-helix repeat-containing protein [Bryobacterales bacterium]
MIPNRKALVFIGLLVIAGAVQAATFINTCPFIISTPGDYLLSADLLCPGGGTGITITSSHVTLKLEGHTIIPAVGSSSGSAISNFSSGITGTPVVDVHILGPGLIMGGAVNSFSFGVSLVGSVTDSEVSGLTVRGSRVAGINADGQAPGTTGLTFTKNTLAGGNWGILVTNLTSSTISENDASGNFIGIQISNEGVTGPPITFSRNIVNGNTNTGVIIDTGFVTAQKNVVSGNGVVGIDVLASQLGVTIALEVTGNTSLANGTVDLNDAVPGCTGSVWSGNKFFTRNQSCID